MFNGSSNGVKEVNMEFEIFTGDHRKKFYVYKKGDFKAVQKELAARMKCNADNIYCYTVWIKRNVDGEDLLYLEKVKGAEKMLAAVRGGV